ncbi:MAG: DUF2782 domain-containing protein [Ectothiorhodospiraceae bacterium]|nr:DUF2782 domain-containing protein [Ectothiorhodospiraceae bacterium]MCH8505491.1 DUF2782 domain-containing protein [Ectothiorhodospiraceae bacterium]
MKLARVLILLLALLAFAGAWADDGERKPIITAPPPPEELTLGDDIEPQVTIIERQWATIEEYSVHGQVYAVKITPAVGPPYYLYDPDGSGQLTTRIEALGATPNLNRWKIIQW